MPLLIALPPTEDWRDPDDMPAAIYTNTHAQLISKQIKSSN
jgi:hypothetical protein